MKIAQKKNTSKKKKIIFILIAILAIGGGLGAFYYLNTQRNNNTTADTPRPVNTVDYNPPSKQEEQATSTQKDQIIDSYNKSQGDSSQAPDSDVTVTISRANQTSAGLSIGTIISGIKTGSCTVTLTKSGQSTVQKTFTITYEATSAFCQEAIVPLGDIPAAGAWELSVTASDGTKTSKAATQTVNIDKP